MTTNASAHAIETIKDAGLDEVHGGLSVEITPVKPIITPQMIANFHISDYFVPRINVIPKG